MRKTRTTPSSPGLARAVKAAALAAVAGCGFHPSGVADTDGTPAEVDAPVPSDGRPPIDAPPGTIDAPASTLCAGGDPTLVLCMPFDDGATTNRAAGGPQPTLSRSITPVAGRVGMAACFAADSSLWIDETSQLDVAAPITMEMFVYYTQDPPTTGSSTDRRRGLIDNNGQYSMFLGWHQAAGATSESVTPYCNINGTAWGAPISKNAWHHVACVHTGVLLTVYTDGIAGIPVATSTPINTSTADGTTLGQDCDGDANTTEDPLIGALDEVRMWTRERTAGEIATAAMR